MVRDDMSESRAARALERWQERLLPFMTIFIIVMALSFFVFSGVHLYQLTEFIEAEHGQNIREQVVAQIAATDPSSRTAEDTWRNSLLLLEADTLDRRYHQAATLLMSRVWSRQLAFVTGMMMAFIGSVFILGKLTETASNISGEAQGWKVAVSSASPGIILSLFGTVLLIASMVVRSTLDVSDGPAYVNFVGMPSQRSTPTDAPPGGVRPLTLDDLQKEAERSASPENTDKGTSR